MKDRLGEKWLNIASCRAIGIFRKISRHLWFFTYVIPAQRLFFATGNRVGEQEGGEYLY